MSPQGRRRRRPPTAPRLEPLEPRALRAGFDPTSAAFVRFAEGTPAATAAADLAAVGGRVVARYPAGPVLVALPAGSDRAAALRALAGAPGVVYAEADGTFHAAGVTASGGPVTPNNPLYLSEWGLGMIDAPYAWSVTTGTASTVVAVLDTGIDLNSPAFAGRVWANPTADVDGFKGDLHGWNFVAGNGNVQDDDGHGTHVSGVIAAAGDTGFGVAGVNWKTRVMPLKILDSQGNGSSDAAVGAVYFAVAHGARVINASWGGDAYDRAMHDALAYADSKGVVFVTAAGNKGTNNDLTLGDTASSTDYPANDRTPNELTVAAVDRTGALAGFSNFGPNTVDLAAPGVGIVSVVPASVARKGYASYDGTSMAAPFVSGTVALVAGMNPGMTASQLVARVRSTAKPLPGLAGLLISPGVVDPLNALLNRTPVGGGGGVSATGNPTPPPAPAPPAPPPPPPTGTPESVESALLTSDDAYGRFGGTAPGYVAGVYRAVLGRAPGADESSYVTAALLAGATSRGVLVAALQGSAEGLRTRVARWFVDDLGVTSVPLAALKGDAGVIYYAGLLASGRSDVDVQGALFDQAIRNLPAWVPAATRVNALYGLALGRDAGPDEAAYYAADLGAGSPAGSVAARLLNSPEGRRTAVARLYRNALGSTAGLAALKADAGVAYWAGRL